MARVSSSSASSRSTTNTCSRSPTRSSNSGSAPATVQPYGLVLRHGRPTVAGYSVLHEGFVGVIGDGGVQEVTYANIEKATGKVNAFKGDGGWLGFTDKYWGSAVIPGADRADRGALLGQRDGSAGRLSGRFPRQGADRSRRAPRSRPRPASSPARRRCRRSTITPSKLGIKKFDLMIDWGWFYFITKPMFLADRRDLQIRRQFRRRDPDRHGHGQARLLPARQSLLPVRWRR